MQRHRFRHHGQIAVGLRDFEIGARQYDRLAQAQRRGLGGNRALGNGDGEIGLRHRDSGDAHIGTHDDDARVLIDDDLGRLIGLDDELLDVGEQVDDIAVEVAGQVNADRRRIFRRGAGNADEIVDREGNAPRGRQIGIAQ